MALQQELKKQKPFASPEAEAYLNLARTHAELGGAFARLFKSHGLSEAGYNVLRILRGVKRTPVDGHKSLPSGEIAGRMVTRVPDVTRLIDRLASAGLVERERSEQDRRVVRVAITAEGMSLLRRLDAPVNRLHEQTMGHLTRGELQSLIRLLEKARGGANPNSPRQA